MLSSAVSQACMLTNAHFYLGTTRIREEEMAKRAVKEKARQEEELRKQEEEKRLIYAEQQRQAEEERIRREQEEQEKLAELQHQVCFHLRLVGECCEVLALL